MARKSSHTNITNQLRKALENLDEIDQTTIYFYDQIIKDNNFIKNKANFLSKSLLVMLLTICETYFRELVFDDPLLLI